MPHYRIDLIDDKTAYLKTEFKYREIARGIPGHRTWNPQEKHWEFRVNPASVKYVAERFPGHTMSPEFKQRVDEVNHRRSQGRKNIEEKNKNHEVTDYAWKTQPYQHQVNAFALSRDKEAYGYLMEMGTGKSKVIIDNIAYLCSKGEINAAVIICPNSIKGNWERELSIHMPEWCPYIAHVWSAVRKNKAEEFISLRTNKIKIFILNVETLSSTNGLAIIRRFMQLHTVFMAVDESSRIKNNSAKRTKACLSLGRLAKYRRIATGTPITQSPLDLYSQLNFLDPSILGFSSYYSFRNHFAVMGGFEGKEVLYFDNLDELHELMAGCTYRVLKSECLDLPEKIYTRVSYDMSPEYRKYYDEMRKHMRTEIAGEEITATIALTKLMRLQQIICGDPNRIRCMEDGLAEILDDNSAKIIIWCRFLEDIEKTSEYLSKRLGASSYVQFHGAVPDSRRQELVDRFQNDPRCRVFIGQSDTGGMGLTLTAAHTVVYFSNSFKLETRLQSEDRAHRIGQESHVTYVDIQADRTIDQKIIDALTRKKALSDLVTGDKLITWLDE